MNEEHNEITGALPEAGTKVRRKPAGRTNVPGLWTRTTQFLRDVRAEMRRVSWPSANEVRNTTIITLIAVIFFALYLFSIDRVWAFLIEHLRGLLGG
jgi:preprotein translocase subunit SecE